MHGAKIFNSARHLHVKAIDGQKNDYVLRVDCTMTESELPDVYFISQPPSGDLPCIL